MSNIEIGFETVKNVIETNQPEIVIEITGLKSLTSFIGLTDTPIYYDNGKFFKVEDNKIIYTDIQWSDIKGKIEDNPELVEQISNFIQQSSQEITDKAIEQHSTNINAHKNIQDNLNDKIDENVDIINSKINNVKIDVDKNKNDILDLTNKHNLDINNLNDKLDDIKTNIDAEISDINDDLTDIVTNISLLDNRVTANTQDIADLTQIVEDDFKEVNEHITNNTTNIANNLIEINTIKDNLKEYSKTNEFADVAFSGDYNDLLNQPIIPSIEGLATTKYVDDEIIKALGDISEFDFLVVEQLPENGESNHIYLIPHEQTENNIYDEYIWLSGSNKFELIGTTAVDLSNYYNKTETDTLLNNKADKNKTGSKLEYNNSVLTLNTEDNIKLSEVTIKSAPDVDDKTIHFNSNEELEVFGNLTKDGTFKYDWIGTEEEYNQGVADGTITNTTMCLVTDDEDNVFMGSSEYVTKVELTKTLQDNYTTTLDLNSALNLKQDTSTAVTHEYNVGVGGNTLPIYIDNNGKVKVCNYSLNRAGSTNNISTKIYLIGSPNQEYFAQTYSNQYNYIDLNSYLVTKTPPAGDNSTKVATTEFIQNIIGNIETSLSEI